MASIAMASIAMASIAMVSVATVSIAIVRVARLEVAQLEVHEGVPLLVRFHLSLRHCPEEGFRAMVEERLARRGVRLGPPSEGAVENLHLRG